MAFAEINNPIKDEKPSYKKVKECVMKKEIGIEDVECKKIFEKIGVSE